MNRLKQTARPSNRNRQESTQGRRPGRRLFRREQRPARLTSALPRVSCADPPAKIATLPPHGDRANSTAAHGAGEVGRAHRKHHRPRGDGSFAFAGARILTPNTCSFPQSALCRVAEFGKGTVPKKLCSLSLIPRCEANRRGEKKVEANKMPKVFPKISKHRQTLRRIIVKMITRSTPTVRLLLTLCLSISTGLNRLATAPACCGKRMLAGWRGCVGDLLLHRSS